MLKRVGLIFLCLMLLTASGCSIPKEIFDAKNNSQVQVNAKDTSSDTEPLTNSEIQQMYSDPEKFKGRTVTLTGQVFAEPERDEDGIYFQIFSDPENNTGNTIVVYSDNNFDLNVDDYIKLTGKVMGTFDGRYDWGGTITAPTIVADVLEKSSYMEVVSPALETFVPDNASITQNGYTISLTKIEFAESETRLYVTVQNAGTANFNLYSFNAKIVQNGKQYEEQSNYKADYPDVQTDLLPGTTTEGIIAFPQLEPSHFQVVLDARSDNYDEDFDLYTFDISVQ